MGAGSFGGFGAVQMAGAMVAMNGARLGGGYGGGSSKPPENESGYSRRSVTIFRWLMLAIFCLSLGYCYNSDYEKEKPISVTIISREILHKGGKHPHSEPTLGVRTDDGLLFDVKPSLAFYSQTYVGERITVERSERFLRPNNKRTLIEMFFGLGMIMSVIVWLVGELGFSIEGIREEKKEEDA